MYNTMRKEFKLLVNKGGVILPGAYNAITAKIIERTGFEGVYISGGGLSAQAGYPDVGLLTLSEFLNFAKYIVDATLLPCICDADTGFGEAVNVYRSIKEFEKIGLAGIHIEDQIFPKRCGHLKGKSLISKDNMLEKINTACLSRTDDNFLIIARTDARSVDGLNAAIDRANSYIEAGADMIFPEALENKNEFMTFAKEVKAPLMANMTEFGVSPLINASELFDFGYKIVIYPMGAFRASLKASSDFYTNLISEGSQELSLKNMTDRKELYEILDYESYANRDSKVAGYKI